MIFIIITTTIIIIICVSRAFYADFMLKMKYSIGILGIKTTCN